MGNLYKVKEQYLSTKSSSDLLEQIELAIGSETNINSELEPYAYAIYIDDNKKTIIDCRIFTEAVDFEQLGFSNKFEDFIQSNQPKCFNDILFLLDIYHCNTKHFPRVSVADIQNTKFTYVPIVDELLKESKGFLIWKHQLENLYLLFNHNREEVDKFCSGISALKTPEIFNIAKSLKFDNGISLEDVINERMALSFVKRPNIRGAFELNNLLLS